MHGISNIGKLIIIWGLMAFLGWIYIYLTNPFSQPIDFFGLGFTASALLWWTILVLIVFVSTWKLFPGKPLQNKTVQVWIALMVIGMLENFLVFFNILPQNWGEWSYFHLWLLLVAIGFFLTAKTWGGASKWYYTVAGILSILLLIGALLQIQWVAQQGFLLAGITQGILPILDGIKNYNQ